MRWQEQLDNLVESLAATTPSASLYMTGSRAIGADRVNSDVDLVLALPDKATADETAEIVRKITEHYSVHIDDPHFLLSVPKVASWSEIKSCYTFESASFGLQFWQSAQLLRGPERRAGRLASDSIVQTSAVHAVGKWLAATLYRLAGSESAGALRAPLGTIGRAARSAALLRSGRWVGDYPQALRTCEDTGDVAIPLFRRRVTAADENGMVTATAEEWGDLVSELAAKAEGQFADGGAVGGAGRSERWLYLERPVPITARWQIVDDAAALKDWLRSRAARPAITPTIAKLARPDSFTASAYLAYLKFNRYNKWIDGALADNDLRWSTFTTRTIESGERLRRILIGRCSAPDPLDSLMRDLSRHRSSPSSDVRAGYAGRWLRIITDSER